MLGLWDFSGATIYFMNKQICLSEITSLDDKRLILSTEYVYDFRLACCKFETPLTRMDARAVFTTLIAWNMGYDCTSLQRHIYAPFIA
jgi:hypothetical protein